MIGAVVTDGIQQAVVCTILAGLFLGLAIFFAFQTWKIRTAEASKERITLLAIAGLCSLLIYGIWFFYTKGWF